MKTKLLLWFALTETAFLAGCATQPKEDGSAAHPYHLRAQAGQTISVYENGKLIGYVK